MHYIPNPLIIPVGIIIGVLVAAPVGPVNVLCIQRAIQRGFFGGVAAGLGAVLGDGLIALLAALGVGQITGAVTQYRNSIQLIGGLALIVFGAMLYRTAPLIEPERGTGDQGASIRDYIWDVPQTFLLTITNPGAVLGLFAIFGGVSSFVEVTGWIESLIMVAAIMGGSLAWWIVLSHLVSRIRHRITTHALHRINRIAGTLLAGLGGLLIGEVVAKALGISLGAF